MRLGAHNAPHREEAHNLFWASEEIVPLAYVQDDPTYRRPSGQSGRTDHPHNGWAVIHENGAHPGTGAAADGIGNAAARGPADEGEEVQPHTRARRCIFVNTRMKTILVHLEAEHTSVDHIRDQVHAREGNLAEHQRLIYAGKQLTRGELSLEDYGVKQCGTLHVPGRIKRVMPQDSGGGSSSSERPRLAFENSMDVEVARLDPLYAQWKVWFETCAPIAIAFLAPEAKAGEALGTRKRATRQRLTEAGVQEMLHWAAPRKPNHEVLLASAAYGKAKPYKVDVLRGPWVAAPKPALQQQPQGQPQGQPQADPKVEPVKKENMDLEAQLAQLRMPKILLCSVEQLKAVSDWAMQAAMERDLLAALQAYGAAPMTGPEDAAKVGEVLRAAVRTTLYLTVTI